MHAISTKINNLMLFPYQLKDAYESTIPQHTSTLHEVNIFVIIIAVSFCANSNKSKYSQDENDHSG